MGKLIIPLFFGVLVGLSGGGFYAVHKVSAAHGTLVATAKKHGAAASGDSTHTEAAADGGAHGATEHSAEPAATTPVGHDSSAVVATAATPATDSTHAATAERGASEHAPPDHTAAAKLAVAATPAAGTTGAAGGEAETEAHQRRLAKIFATMGAKDASRVLAQMTDHDVSIILGLLSNRQAAAILATLPAPRAAALSNVQPRRGGTE